MLGYNDLTGLLPNSVCNMSELDVLGLLENKFCPPYPDCLTEEDVGSQTNASCDNYCESGETPVLDADYIGCYNDDDLDFLEDVINNSTGSNKPDANLAPWKLGHQIWENRRLKSFCCSSMDLSTFPQLEGGLASCETECPYVLDGAIPSSIENLSSLDTLALVGMDFEGTIPEVLSSLVDLKVLLLTGNADLTGSLPVNIGNIQGLKHISFKNNDLTGSMPSSFWNLTNLISIDLSNNRFSDALSNTLDYSDFSFLKWFDIEDNNFHGLIPDNICDLSYVNVSTYADNFEFDGNLFCPPFPVCMNTSNSAQNVALVSYYEDANLNGFGNPDVVCAEQYCEDYPPTGGDCTGYVSDNSDQSDACPNNELRDECGECGGDGFLANCTDGSCQNMDCNGDCLSSTIVGCIGSGCGTAQVDNCGVCAGGGTVNVANSDYDECNICNGPNTDCSSGYDASTCPNMDSWCGSCTGNPVCLPQLDRIEPAVENLININTNSVLFYFTAPIDYQTDGIELESHNGTNIDFNVSLLDSSTIQLTLVNPLISNDQVEISINPCKILSFFFTQYFWYSILFRC